MCILAGLHVGAKSVTGAAKSGIHAGAKVSGAAKTGNPLIHGKAHPGHILYSNGWDMHLQYHYIVTCI